MEMDVVQGDIARQETDCIVVNLFEGISEPGGATGALDRRLDGAISHLIAGGDFNGTAGSTALLYSRGIVSSPRVLIVGLGPAEKFNMTAARKAAATAASTIAKLKGTKRYATVVHGAGTGGLDEQAAAQALAEGVLLATYRAPQYRRTVAEMDEVKCTVVELDEAKVAAVSAGVQAGIGVAKGVCSPRSYVSEPPNILYPKELARRAKAMAEETGLACTILGKKEMEDLGMGILLAVSRGSRRKPRMIVLEHALDGVQEAKPLVLVGKGVTFDTGGISIKPSDKMWYMKDDMGGAAAVIGAMEAISRLHLPRRVIGVAACVENMPDGKAYRPSDILTGITGKNHAEILSTDAEGRLILADALGYVARFDPAAVVDLATLTGAIGVALGSQAAGLFANHELLQDALMRAAEGSGERLWPMPMYDEYKEAIKSDIAEVKNSAGRTDGVATSAKFIEHFTEGYPWAHLDIASMVWTDSDGEPLVPKGATGYGVRLLVELTKTF